MIDFKRCDICKNYHWTNVECAPIYDVYHDDYLGEDPKQVRAHDFEDAAIEYAKYYNDGDFPLMDGEPVLIEVEKDGVRKKFNISAEPSIHYSADEVK